MKHLNICLLTIFLFFVFSLLPSKVNAAIITVSPGQSIQSAVNAAAPGDTIQVRAGTYPETVNVSKSGIVLMGYPGEKPVIDGQNSRSSGIAISGSTISVTNFKVTNHTGHDVEIDRSSNVTLDNLEVYITGRAVHIQESNNILVKNCTITTPTYIARQTDGIYSQRNRNNIYENNYIVIYNSHPDGHDDAIQMYQDESTIVRGNYLAQVNDKRGNAQGLYATTMYGTSKFYNNVVDLGNAQSNALSFLKLPELGGTGTVEIIGNTVYAIRPYHCVWAETDNAVVKNNINYCLNGVGVIVTGSGNVVSNNLTTDPKFVSLSSKDFHLQAGSPAIDKGVTLGAPYNVDKDGKSRPIGSAWDIGAYEYGAGNNTPSPSPFKIGDVNNDGSVNILDIGVIIDNYGKFPIPNPKADVNTDGSCDILDIGVVIDNYGQ